jgi:glucose-1-phosphate cytidylyltransferase
MWEGKPLTTIAHDGQLVAYKHEGFWQPMDTLREKNMLNELWENNKAPWKVW